MRERFLPADLAFGVYAAALSVYVAASDLPRAWAYHALHAGACGAIAALAWARARWDRPLWRVAHHWYPLVAIPAAFRELNFITRPILEEGRILDEVLARIDEALFGDVKAWCDALAHPWLADLLTVGYWSYFVMPMALGWILYRRDLRTFRRAAAILVVAWLTSYVGYILVPGRGPHFFEPRHPALEGALLAGPAYRILLEIEKPITDIFPSGHTLVTILVLILAWRDARRLFWVLLPFGCACVAGTVYLRYHYVIDVVVALPWAAGAWACGAALARWWEAAPALSTEVR